MNYSCRLCGYEFDGGPEIKKWTRGDAMMIPEHLAKPGKVRKAGPCNGAGWWAINFQINYDTSIPFSKPIKLNKLNRPKESVGMEAFVG